MIPIDSRLRTTLRDDRAAQSLLNDLHRQILARPHPSVLPQLLGRYVATAAARSGGATMPPSPVQIESSIFTSISNIMKSAHDTANAIIQNIKA